MDYVQLIKPKYGKKVAYYQSFDSKCILLGKANMCALMADAEFERTRLKSLSYNWLCAI